MNICRYSVFLFVWLGLANGIALADVPLLRVGQQSVTFALRDEKNSTPRLLLFDRPEEMDTAASINYWRGTADQPEPGVVVALRGLRFLRVDGGDMLAVRLIGIKNEFETKGLISLAVLESGEIQKLRFGPVTMGFAPLSCTTDVEMTLRYEPRTRELKIFSVSGSIAWQKLFADPQTDSGSLENLVGKVAEIPAGAMILKAE